MHFPVQKGCFFQVPGTNFGAKILLTCLATVVTRESHAMNTVENPLLQNRVHLSFNEVKYKKKNNTVVKGN